MDIFTDFNVKFNSEIMVNREHRYRLMGNDGSGYIRTIAEQSAWENSHSHKFLKEMYIVQKGWIVFAEYKNGNIELKKYKEGDFFVTEPLVVHNVYMSLHSITHTVKFGSCQTTDWSKDEKVDIATKKISFDILLNMQPNTVTTIEI